MSLLLIDGFDYYSTAQLGLKYDSPPALASIDSTGGRRGTGALKFDGVGANPPLKFPFTVSSTIVCGFAFYAASFPGSSTTYPAFSLHTQGGSRQLSFLVLSDGRIRVSRDTTTIGTTTNALLAGQWYYIEISVTAGTTNGSVQIQVNGVEWLNKTGQNTLQQGGGDYGQLGLANSSGSSGGVTKYDDLYIDSASMYGDCRVDVLVPTGAGNYTQWTASAGSNFACVDELPASDADYVYTSTVGNKDSYVFGDLPAGGGTIHGVAVSTFAAKTSSTVRGVRPFVRIGTTDYEGNEAVLSTASDFYTQIWEDNPATATTWQESEVNSAEFGVKLST